MTTITKTPEHPIKVISSAGRTQAVVVQHLHIVTEARERLARALYHVLDADMPVMATPDVVQLQDELALAEANLQAAVDDHTSFMAPLPVARVERFRNTAWLSRLCHKKPLASSYSGRPFTIKLPLTLERCTHLMWNGATNGQAMTLVTMSNDGIAEGSKHLKDDSDVLPIHRVLRDVLKPRMDWKPTSMAKLVAWAGHAVPSLDYTNGLNVRAGNVAGVKLNTNVLAVALPPVEDPHERCYVAGNEKDNLLLLRGDGWMTTVAGWQIHDNSAPMWKNPPVYEL